MNYFNSTSARIAGVAEQADDVAESMPGAFDLGQAENEYALLDIEDVGLIETPLLGSRPGPRYGAGEDLALLISANMSGLTVAETFTVSSLNSGAVSGGIALPALESDTILTTSSLVGWMLVGVAFNERVIRLGSALNAGGFILNSAWGAFLGVVNADCLVADVIETLNSSWTPMLYGLHVGGGRTGVSSSWGDRRDGSGGLANDEGGHSDL